MIDLHVVRAQGEFTVQAGFRRRGNGVTALFGPSGAGKTSIVNMVAGLLQPDEGHIVINQRCLYDRSRRINLPPEKRRIGYIFQDGRLLPHLSVRANLTYGMQLTPAPERFIPFEQVVDLLGIGHLLKRRPASLSGGEKQRVAIGRALLTSPDLLLMDEPLASLDQARKHEVLPFIQRLCREFSLPVLYVSHSMDEIINLADHLVVLEHGRVKAADTMEALMGRPDLAPLFGRADFGSVLHTIVTQAADDHGLSHLHFKGGTLKVPGVKAAQGSSLRVQIPAHNVGIALQPPVQTSYQNIFSGTIESISQGSEPFVDLSLNIGCPLLARVTLSAKAQLGLHKGQKVYALVKSVNISPGRYG